MVALWSADANADATRTGLPIIRFCCDERDMAVAAAGGVA